MENTDYTKFTPPKDCTPAVANIERCFNGDPLRMRITIPGVASALVFSKLRLRLSLKDEPCTDGAHQLPVKGIVPAPVYSSIILNGNMLYEAEANLTYPPKALPYILELTAANATIEGNAYSTTEELYNALQAIVADCTCNCGEEPAPELVARMVGMEVVIEGETPSATIDTGGSTGNFIRLSYEQNGGDDPDVDGDWEPNTGGNIMVVDVSELFDGGTTAIRVEVSDDMLTLGNVHTAAILRGDGLYLPQPAADFDFPVDALFAACSGTKSFAAAILVVANNGLNATTGVLAVDETASTGQPFVVYRLCDGDIDNIYLATTAQGAVRVASLDIDIGEIGATSNLPTTGDYNLLLQYSADDITYNDCDAGDTEYNTSLQTDTYTAGIGLGGHLRSIFSRPGVMGLTYTDTKIVPFPIAFGKLGTGEYIYSFIAAGLDSSHPDYTGHLFKQVALQVNRGTYAGTHSIPNFAPGGTPDISSLPVGLQALLTAGANSLAIDEYLWLVEGCTDFYLKFAGSNVYGAINIDSSAVQSSYIP